MIWIASDETLIAYLVGYSLSEYIVEIVSNWVDVVFAIVSALYRIEYAK